MNKGKRIHREEVLFTTRTGMVGRLARVKQWVDRIEHEAAKRRQTELYAPELHFISMQFGQLINRLIYDPERREDQYATVEGSGGCVKHSDVVIA